MLKYKWYNLYDKIVYRNLRIQRDKEFMSKLQEFVENNIGKKYSLTVNKLFKFKSTILGVEQEQKKSQEKEKKEGKAEERTFFCSELVAAAYKHLGLLPQNISTTQYWPGSFAHKKPLQLLHGELSAEYMIDFIE